MKRLSAIVCVFATWTAVSCGYLTESLVKRAVPAFPELPAPVEDLSDGQTGLIHFETSTPFDLDVLLDDPNLGRRTTGVGTLFLPDAAGHNARAKVPAMIVLHGSGGISPRREME